MPTTHAARLRRAVPLFALLAAASACTAGTGAATATTPASSAVTAGVGTASSPVTTRPTTTPQTTAPAATAAQPSPEHPSATASSAPADGRTQTTLTVTTLAWNPGTSAVEASAYVPLVESGGTCTLTLTSTRSIVTSRSTAYPDASTTSCDLLSVPKSQLAPGSWKALVAYSSPATRATSAPITIEVP